MPKLNYNRKKNRLQKKKTNEKDNWRADTFSKWYG